MLFVSKAFKNLILTTYQLWEPILTPSTIRNFNDFNTLEEEQKILKFQEYCFKKRMREMKVCEE